MRFDSDAMTSSLSLTEHEETLRQVLEDRSDQGKICAAADAEEDRETCALYVRPFKTQDARRIQDHQDHAGWNMSCRRK